MTPRESRSWVQFCIRVNLKHWPELAGQPILNMVPGTGDRKMKATGIILIKLTTKCWLVYKICELTPCTQWPYRCQKSVAPFTDFTHGRATCCWSIGHALKFSLRHGFFHWCGLPGQHGLKWVSGYVLRSKGSLDMILTTLLIKCWLVYTNKKNMWLAPDSQHSSR